MAAAMAAVDISARALQIAENFGQREPGSEGFDTVRLRYLPPHRLAEWDLRYETSLEQLLYIEHLIDEDEPD